MNDNNARQNIVDNIKKVDTILVTVSTNPSVDELSAALALTMFINDIDKHATAVVSGNLPPAIHFLEPEKTFEDTVDSLRDFVIALDKEKADHLRYKVEGDVVKIFITPYKTIITSKDLDYSQGDYNVEMVIALGVKDKDRLDTALAAHGRILHDAIVATIGLEPSELGTLDYSDGSASSMAELVARVIFALSDGETTMSEQVASALLTGIVAATDRFSNDHTTSEVMSTAAKLMSAGANQQLIASKLREGSKTPMVDDQVSEKIEKDQGEKKSRKRRKSRGLSIEHGGDESANTPKDTPDTVSTDEPVTLEAMLEKSANQQPEANITDTEVSSDSSDVSEQNDTVQNETPQEVASSQDNESLSAEAMLDDALGATGASETVPAADLAVQLEQEASAEAASQGQSQEDIAQNVENVTANEVGSAQVANSPEDKPRFGGVLNATTEQAAEDKRRAEAADRNRTILSHDRPSQGYVEQSLSSSPLNGAGEDRKEEMFNPLAEPVANPELPPVPNIGAATMPPAASSVGEPTLADIDLQNREVPRVEPVPSASVEFGEAPAFTPVPAPEDVSADDSQAASSALEAVQAAYEAAPIQTPAPIITPAMEAVRANESPQVDAPMMPMADLSAGIPTPPPPPPPEFGINGLPEAPQGAPVPDFSQLPTPPTVPDMNAPAASPVPTLPPENLETILPPPQNVAPPSAPSDPGEFRIPGQ